MKCNSDFYCYSKWGEKTFCSRSCANSRVFSDEAKKKKSDSLKGRKSAYPNSVRIKDKEQWKRRIKDTALKKYIDTPFEELGNDGKRRRVLEEQNHKCSKCGINEWMGKQLTLELDHIDGNNTNNSRSNLEGLCPNCHSITDTWRGRNKPSKNGKIINKITDEELLTFLNSSENIRQGLLRAGLSAKGNNYARAKRILGL